MLVLFLLGAAVSAGAVTVVDRPETNFNEADLPINLGLPAQTRIQDLRPIVVPVVLLPTLPLYCAHCFAASRAFEPAVVSVPHQPLSRQVLLCTFLI
jgi:hypothetical protein